MSAPTQRATAPSIVLCLALLLGSSTIAASQPTPFVCGDADGDGVVTVTDGVQVLTGAAELGGTCAASADACDVDGDGEVTVTDGVAVLRQAAGLAAASQCTSPVVGDESIAHAAVAFPGCESVTAESRYCLTFGLPDGFHDTTLAVLGLDSGRLCNLAEVPPELGTGNPSGSIGWRGEILYVCTEAGLVRVSLLDGSTERLPIACEAVAANDGALFVMRSFADATADHPPGEVRVYASYDDLRADDAATTYVLQTASRLSATDDRLYAAWHSTHTVESVDPTTGAQLALIELEAYDDWVNGFSVVEDGSLVVNKYVGGSGVLVFDAATGGRSSGAAPERPVNGLACVARP